MLKDFRKAVDIKLSGLTGAMQASCDGGCLKPAISVDLIGM